MILVFQLRPGQCRIKSNSYQYGISDLVCNLDLQFSTGVNGNSVTIPFKKVAKSEVNYLAFPTGVFILSQNLVLLGSRYVRAFKGMYSTPNQRLWCVIPAVITLKLKKVPPST